MKIFAIVQDDLVTGTIDGNISAPNEHLIPESLTNEEVRNLRFDGSTIVLISNYTKFYIDSDGIKHISKFNEEWQEIDCSYDVELYYDVNIWRIKTDIDKLSELKEEKLNYLTSFTKEYIELHYPIEKQVSFNSLVLSYQIELQFDVEESRKNILVDKISKVLSVQSWIESVISYHYQLEANVIASQNITELEAVQIDFSDFNSTDPKVQLRDIK